MQKTDGLIMAAGTSRRFGTETPKQFLPLHGRPMVAWSAERFAEHEAISSLTLVVPPGYEDDARRIVETHHLDKIDRIVAGGDTRQQSVWAGLEALDTDSERVLVHDAARPCVSRGLLDRLLEALGENDGVVPVMPVVDTIVHEMNERVDALIDRVHVSGVQTPQAFRTELLRRAHRKALAGGFSANDDGSLVFALSEPVRTIPGERTNIKITYEEDLRIAEAILSLQQQS